MFQAIIGYFIGILVVAFAMLIFNANQKPSKIPKELIEADGGYAFTLKDGRTLEYFDSLTKDAPILLGVHGGFCTGEIYFHSGMEKQYRLIAPTIPGFGGSSSNNGRTIASYGDDVKELLDHLKIQQFYLMGASWGGAHAMGVIQSMPERVLGVALVAPAVPSMSDFPLGWTGTIDDLTARLMHHYLMPVPYLNRFLVRYVFRPLLNMDYSDSNMEAAVGKPLGALQKLPLERKSAIAKGLARSVKWNVDGQCDLAETTVKVQNHFDYVALGKSLGKTPVRIFIGDSDILVVRANAEYIVDKFKKGGATNVQLTIIPNEGHAFALTGPDSAPEKLFA